jgi:thiosulfate/3-mercaptopyruvate sulfurtransferase
MPDLDKYTTLISTQKLADHPQDPAWVIIDCRFSLDETERGRRDYEEAHIPGAIYAHLDEDLSGGIVPGKTGRHPLPGVDVMTTRFGRWGIGPGVQVVAYDDAGGAIAARLWWLLKWLGHDATAVLDGGWPHWIKTGLETRGGIETGSSRKFVPRERPEMWVKAGEVESVRQDPESQLLDSRTLDRYRGQNETIDPVAGHIPGAVCLPYSGNLDENGLFLSRDQLRMRFQKILDATPPEAAVFYCGSGVTAVHNLLAMAYGGLGLGRLYAGSWSEWITDSRRPVAQD